MPPSPARLLLHAPDQRRAERAYVAEVVFSSFLGLSVDLTFEARSDWLLCLPGAPGCIRWPDAFLGMPDAPWLQPDSVPPSRQVRRLPWTDLPFPAPAGPDLPLLLGEPGRQPAIARSGSVDLAADVLGTAFFGLTRYEEVAAPVVGDHGRYPAHAALATRAGLHHRAIVDEHTDLLAAALAWVWPSLPQGRRQFQVLLSHDVDWPFASRRLPAWVLARKLLVDLGWRRSPRLAGQRLAAALARRPDWDPYDTFAFLLDTARTRGLPQAFNFIAGHTDPSRDGVYHLDHPEIQDLLVRLAGAGAEIGLHPSYRTYLDGPALAREYEHLRTQAAALGVARSQWGGRQHYLRWQAPTTWRIWEEAGLVHDSSVYFAEAPGFRCGTCREFPVFDLRARRRLNLIERPLIVMEGSLFDREHLALPPDAALDLALDLARTCARHQGCFHLLWHNSSLYEPWQRSTYLRLVQALADMKPRT